MSGIDSHSHGGWDVHVHLVPPGVVVAGENGHYGMQVAPGSLKICGHGVPLHPISEVGKLLERMQSDKLDGAVVSVPPPLFRPDLSKAERRDYAALVNDSLLSACQAAQKSLRPFAYLPAEDPELGVEIATGLDRQWAGVVMGTQLGTLSYASPRFDSLWQVLSNRKLPLFIHPGSTPDERLEPFYMTNLVGNPFETTIAAANLIFAGVMHRFPELKVILAHGGGCLAALCGRWQRGVVTRRPGIPELQLAPVDAARHFYVDSLVHSALFLESVIKLVGEDRVLLGSDWPFPMGTPHADHDLGGLAPTLRQRIRKTNAEDAFGFRLKN
jgi:aminocarboxymuconate-semialdehyde decarboxylase